MTRVREQFVGALGMASVLAIAATWSTWGSKRAESSADATIAHANPSAESQAPVASLEGATGWINADGPVHLEQLRGKVVLLDFWTYCCINCHHVLPDLARLEEKYRNQLVVVGVHTAKFDAEKVTENIRSKVREYGIKHPVANDANQAIWDRFGVRSWPTLVLIDPSGRVVKSYAGEGHGAELDATIRDLVAQATARGQLDQTPVTFPAEMDRPEPGGLLFPGKVTADLATARLYVSDTGHHRVVVTDLEGKFVEAIGSGRPGLVDGDYAKAGFHRPQGTCLVGRTLYVADTEDHAVRAVDLDKKMVSTVAGTGQQGQSYDANGPGTETAISSPWDVAWLPREKKVAIAMAGTHQIWAFDVDRKTVGWLAGSGYENIQDGPAADARFAQPSGLAVDGSHLFVADSEVSGLRSVSTGSGNVSTIVGQGLFQFGDVDGQGPAVRLQHCLGLAFADGKLYVADSYNNKVKVCDPKTKRVQALVGTGRRGAADAPAQFDEPGGLSVAGGTLFVADTNNHLIRAVDLASKAVRTLDLSSVPPPSLPKKPQFANARTFEVEEATVMPAKAIDFDVNLALPPGYKLSQEAPLVTLVEADALGLVDPAEEAGREIDRPEKSFKLTVPLAKQPAVGSTSRFKVSVSAFVCLPNSLCTIKNYVWVVPIKFGVGPLGPIRLSTGG